MEEERDYDNLDLTVYRGDPDLIDVSEKLTEKDNSELKEAVLDTAWM